MALGARMWEPESESPAKRKFHSPRREKYHVPLALARRNKPESVGIGNEGGHVPTMFLGSSSRPYLVTHHPGAKVAVVQRMDGLVCACLAK
jgi:hypothetical protein